MSSKATSRKHSAVKNSSIGLLCLSIPILLNFFSRRFFIDYLSIEYLGVSGAFGSILNTLSLSELGIQVAIVYCLYKPLKDNDTVLINSLMNVMRIIYKWIGIGFIIFPILFIPFLGVIVKGIEVDNTISLCFFVESCSSAFTYFLAYKRTLLFADQKEYISKLVDLACNIVFILIQLYTLYRFQSYLLFCFINCIRNITANVIVSFLCRKRYPYLHNEKFSKETFKPVWNYTKNIIFLKLAGSVYGLTDNLVLSSILGVASVGYLGNYTTITSKLSSLSNAVLAPIVPIIGNLLLDNDKNNSLRIFKVYTFIRFILASFIIIPLYIVIDDFIIWWIGEKYVLDVYIKFLICVDIYIHIYHSSICDFISAAGLFKQEKYIGITGAILNLVTSILFVYKLGVVGVLIGTVISQMFFWLSRSILVYTYCFEKNKIEFLKYWKRVLSDLVMFLITISIAYKLFQNLVIPQLFAKVIIGAILSLLITTIIYLIFYFRSREFKYILKNFIHFK